jgi:hypothetical protein
MPRIGKGWKEAGMDTSPPRPEPSEKAKLEMVVGRVASLRNAYMAKRVTGAPGVPNETCGPARCREYERWVAEFMTTEATRIEMQAGAAALLRRAKLG